jgi:hypothetical protein
MDTIEFVITVEAVSDGFDEDRIEPVINGVSLVDLAKRAEQRPAVWIGLRSEELLGPLRTCLAISRQIGDRVAVLRCGCGHRDCAEITAEVVSTADQVTWGAFRNPQRRPEAFADLDAFTFPRSVYQDALSNPRRAGAPVRDLRVLAALSRGEPVSARDWLQLAYVEADWPAASEALPRLLEGLRKRSRAGNPVLESEAYAWARELGWHEGTIGTIVGLVRAANNG